jgi:hypothetical protein
MQVRRKDAGKMLLRVREHRGDDHLDGGRLECDTGELALCISTERRSDRIRCAAVDACGDGSRSVEVHRVSGVVDHDEGHAAGELIEEVDVGFGEPALQQRIPPVREDRSSVGFRHRRAEGREDAVVTEGHRTVEFVIVGSGPNGADPHHEVSDRVIEEGDVVVVDIGGAVPSGYNSDSTRTYVVGTPDPAAAERIAVLVRAQQAAVDAVRPGVTAAEVDAAARTVLADAGLGEAFLHRTGHGIGVSVHEEPYIAPGNDLVLREGMAFSIEPGIYFAGSWGARIEDIVIVTADGGERLNVAPHELTSVGVR